MEVDPGTNLEAGSENRSWRQRVWHEMRTHPVAYVVLVAFVVAGPLVTSLLFPEAPLAVGVIGGAALGVYAALCAVPGQFL